MKYLLIVITIILLVLRQIANSATVDYTIAPLTAMNSSADDYAPGFMQQKGVLTFSSERNGTAALFFQDNNSAQEFSGTFNKHGAHRAFVSFCNSGEAVGVKFYQHNTQAQPGITTVICDSSSANEGLPILILNGNYFVSHPTLSPDGTRLAFVSNRPGGVGGLDIWVSDRREGREWTEPVLLSTTVNSTSDEITPVFLSNDSLTYASNGYGGLGGFDVFITVNREGKWTEPEPLELVNSEFDDSDCTKLPDGSWVFATNRPGGLGNLDLWIAKPRFN